MRKAIVFGGAAIVLGVCLVLPVVGNKRRSGAVGSRHAEPPTPIAESQAHANAPGRNTEVGSEFAPTRGTLATSALAPISTTTEAEAGALLLAGRRSEALALYRELARSSKPTAGIEAMVEVLSQHVPPR